MPRSHFITLIIRLAIGLVILGIIGAILFFRLRKPTTPTPSETATPEPGVVIITPTPEPGKPFIPDVGEVPTESKGGVTVQGHKAPVRRVVRTRRTTTTTAARATATVSVNGTSQTATATSTSGAASASASASAGSSSASASSWAR